LGEARFVFLRGHELRTAHGRERDRFQQREADRGRDGHAELEEENADEPAHQQHGNEDRDDRNGRGGGGKGDLARAVERGLVRRLAHVEMARDVFQHHDGVIHHDADGQRHAEQGEEVDREPEIIEHDEGAQRGGGDGEQHVERGGPRAQKRPADQAGDDDGKQHGHLGFPDRLGGEAGAVKIHRDMEIRRVDCQFLVDLGDEGLHRLAHRHVVLTVLFLDAHPQRGLAVAACHAPRVGEAILNCGHVAEVDIRMVDALAAARRDEQVAHLFGRDRLAHGADVELGAGIFQVTRGSLVVLQLQRVAYVEDGELPREQFIIVDPDAQVPVSPSAEHDVAHAGDHAQAVAQVQVDVGQHLLERALRRRDCQPHDRVVVGVDLLDGRRKNVVRQLHRAQLRVRLLQRRVDVLARIEREFDRGDALPHVRLDVLDALHGDHRLLDRVDDLGLHHLRRRARPRRRDGQHRLRGFGQLADAEVKKADRAEEHQRAHQHPGKNGTADGDVGKDHARAAGWERGASARGRMSGAAGTP
jgi:hypothetical protein